MSIVIYKTTMSSYELYSKVHDGAGSKITKGAKKLTMEKGRKNYRLYLQATVIDRNLKIP